MLCRAAGLLTVLLGRRAGVRHMAAALTQAEGLRIPVAADRMPARRRTRAEVVRMPVRRRIPAAADRILLLRRTINKNFAS